MRGHGWLYAMSSSKPSTTTTTFITFYYDNIVKYNAILLHVLYMDQQQQHHSAFLSMTGYEQQHHHHHRCLLGLQSSNTDHNYRANMAVKQHTRRHSNITSVVKNTAFVEHRTSNIPSQIDQVACNRTSETPHDFTHGRQETAYA